MQKINPEQLKNDWPLVTIAIPVYCGSRYLEKTIDSVFFQTYPNIEIVIVDDHSTDNSEKIILKYNDSRIRYFRHEKNMGAAASWNHCLSEARGIYFKLLPQDDMLFNDTIMRQVQVLEEDKEQYIALTFGSRVIVDQHGRLLLKKKLNGNFDRHFSGRDLIRLCVRRGTNMIGEPGTGLVRTATARNAGGYDDSLPYLVDLDHWLKILKYGDALYLKDPVNEFRVSVNAWSSKLVRQQFLDFSKFLDKIEKNSHFPISHIDILIGKTLAFSQNLLRAIFYKYLLFKS